MDEREKKLAEATELADDELRAATGGEGEGEGETLYSPKNGERWYVDGIMYADKNGNTPFPRYAGNVIILRIHDGVNVPYETNRAFFKQEAFKGPAK